MIRGGYGKKTPVRQKYFNSRYFCRSVKLENDGGLPPHLECYLLLWCTRCEIKLKGKNCRVTLLS